MEVWLLISKLTLLFFIAFNSLQANTTHVSWIVFSFLLYFCINITLYILKYPMIKRILLLLSITLSIVSYETVQPLLIILLPLSIVEIMNEFIEKKIIIFLFSMLPVFYIHESLYALYILVAAMSFFLFSITVKYENLYGKSEFLIDNMRKKIQKLTKNLTENNDFIRQSEYTFKLEERNRISQEIHDKIGHSMTGALIQMEAAKKLLESDINKSAELLQNAINISKDGIENIRMTLKNMKPPVEQVGIHRMKLFIDEYPAKHHIQTLFTHDGNLDIISPIQWKIIHENVAEALTNTMKYSSATIVSVDIKVLNKIIRVEVKDNGIGAEKITKGLGIIGMEERTASIGGNIIVDSSDGFSVTSLLPILHK
jgi:signal transduction histidine kinase